MKSCRARLAEQYGVVDLAIFGSFAKGQQKKRSGIDIMVELDKSQKTFDNYMELKFFLNRLTGGKVDLVLKETLASLSGENYNDRY